MADKNKSHQTKNKAVKAKNKSLGNYIRSYFAEFRFRTSDWLVITLGVLIVECLFIIGNTNAWRNVSYISSFMEIFYFPLIPAFIVMLFCMAFIYKAIQRKHIRRYSIVIATLLSIIGFLFLFGLTSNDGSCGGTTSCFTDHQFRMYVFFLNPISLMIESFLAATATIALFPLTAKNNSRLR